MDPSTVKPEKTISPSCYAAMLERSLRGAGIGDDHVHWAPDDDGYSSICGGMFGPQDRLHLPLVYARPNMYDSAAYKQLQSQHRAHEIAEPEFRAQRNALAEQFDAIEAQNAQAVADKIGTLLTEAGIDYRYENAAEGMVISTEQDDFLAKLQKLQSQHHEGALAWVQEHRRRGNYTGMDPDRHALLDPLETLLKENITTNADGSLFDAKDSAAMLADMHRVVDRYAAKHGISRAVDALASKSDRGPGK